MRYQALLTGNLPLLCALLCALAACAPAVPTPAYSAEGAASTGTFNLTVQGALTRTLSGVAYTTTPGVGGAVTTLSMGVLEGNGACAVSVAIDGRPASVTYRAYTPDAETTRLTFNGALTCEGDAWLTTTPEATLTFTEVGERLRGSVTLPLYSPHSDSRALVRGQFDVANPY